MSLSCRGRVVRNSAALIIVLVAFTWANAQSLRSKQITFCCSSSNFETIIEDLSKVTGVHFVYSSNKIQTSQPITIAVKNKPLGEVLDVLSKQMNLSFKIQEHYITVKPNGVQFLSAPIELVSLKKAIAPHQLKSSDQNSDKTERPLGKFVAEKMKSATELSSSNEDITPYVAKLKPYFDPTFLKKVPIQYLKSTAKKLHVDNNWFVTVGAVVNDYSAGMEVQAGLVHSYVVFSPTWLRDNQYHGALGLGTSLTLSNFLSLRPVYSYASMKETEIDHVNAVFVKSPSYQVNTTTNHHQLKLMLQYDVSKKMKFRVGPTFNQSRSASSFQPAETIYHRTAPPQYNSQPDGVGTGPRGILRSTAAQSSTEVISNKFWVGWEASFSFRINFR